MAVKYTIPYRSMDDQQWRIDISDNLPGSVDPVFNYTIVQDAFPLVKAGVSISDRTSGEYMGGGIIAGNGSVSVTQAHPYQITATMNNMPANPNPRLRLTIYENNVLIFDKSVPAPNPGAEIIKIGTAIPGYIYDITVTGDYSATQVTPVDDPSDPSGIPIPIRGNGSAGVIAWTPDNTDDPFSCYKSSMLTINLIQEGQIDISELQTAQDRDYVVRQYLNGVLKWQGFLVPDGISYPLLSNPNNITLTAICGLTMLADIPYVHTDLQGTTSAIDYCPMNYIRDILFLNLGSYLPIRWTNLLSCTAFDNQDVFAGGVQWSVNGEGYLSYQSGQNGDSPGPKQKCDYILKGILQSMQCTIYLADGRWNIRRINDLVRTTVPYKQVGASTGIMTVHSGTQNLTQQIGRYGFPFINQNPLITTKRGVKTCKTTYNANIRDNILPNGNQDLQINVNNGPLYWTIFNPNNPFTVSSSNSLDGRGGFKSAIIYQGDYDPSVDWFTMFQTGDTVLGKNGLPIDTKTMIAYINFGFMFEVVGGFPTLPGGTIINWADNPLQIKVIFNVGGLQLFLNEFGFWVNTDTSISIKVDNLQVSDVAQIDFNAFQNVIIPTPPTGDVVAAGYESDIQILFRVLPGQYYFVDNIYINIDKGNDVYESTYSQSRNTTTDERTLNISSSFGGYQLSNFMSSPFNSDEECFFSDAAVYTGTLTGLNSNAIMRCMYKAMRILNTDINVFNQAWSFDNTFLVDSMGTSLFLPLNASYDTEKCQVNGLVAIEVRNDFIGLDEKYYNSNDQQLSN